MQIFRARQSETHGGGDFQIRRVRPGLIGGPNADPALGPLACFDHAILQPGKTVAMHEHRNDEILTYMVRGTMVHEDSTGQRIPVSAHKLMMMNAGAGFRHEETATDGPVEALQIFVRPREADLPAKVAFYDRPDGVPVGRWGWIAGPEGSGAPLIVRNAVHLYDTHVPLGDRLDVPQVEGLVPLLYVIDGVVELGGERLGRGDGASDPNLPLPPILARADASLALFLVDRTASGSKAGTISGR